MRNISKGFIAVAIILTVLSVTLYALPAFAEPIGTQTQERGEDCPQICEPCEDCDYNRNQYGKQNSNFRTCGDCDCDGSQKRTRTGQNY